MLGVIPHAEQHQPNYRHHFHAMSDEENNVGAGSETSGEQTDTAQAETADTNASETAQVDEETSADSAGGAADADSSETSGETAADANASRTGFVTGARPSDDCICPDGRKGTVHKFDEGLVCIPNADQG
jgi:hypothetical protein